MASTVEIVKIRVFMLIGIAKVNQVIEGKPEHGNDCFIISIGRPDPYFPIIPGPQARLEKERLIAFYSQERIRDQLPFGSGEKVVASQ